MYTGLLHTHSFLRWIYLILLVTVVVKSFLGLVNKQNFTQGLNKLNLFLFITAHTQLLVGLVLYFSSNNLEDLKKISEIMKAPEKRFFVIEHGFAMVIAIALITIGRISMKKTDDEQKKHLRLAIYNILALLITLWAIPWSRGLF